MPISYNHTNKASINEIQVKSTKVSYLSWPNRVDEYDGSA